MNFVKLTVLACKEKDEMAGPPQIIGGFNSEYLNQLDLETADEIIQKLKEQWTMDPLDYDWREVEVAIEMSKVNALFDKPEIRGIVTS